jgi:DNA-binding transcriptional LysR family regulator
MEIRELRSLVTLARTGNITKAGRLLHLTPSAIHRQLQILSEELDLPLYEKQGRALRLTSEARHLLPLIEELLLQYEAVRAAAEDWKRLERGSVRIGAGPTFSSYVLPAFLEAFRSRYSKLEVFLEVGHAGPLLEELDQGAIDVAFLVARPGLEKKYAVDASWEFEIPLVSSPRMGPSGVVSLNDLAEFPFLLYRQESYFEQQIAAWFQRHNFSPNVVMRLDNAEPMKALVRSGFGIAPIPEWAVTHELEAGQLVRVSLSEPPLVSRLAMLHRRTPHLPAPTAALIRMARERFRHGLRRVAAS